jgi:hypothetical protein
MKIKLILFHLKSFTNHFINDCNRSIGKGKMMVEFFSVAMVAKVCKYRSWRAAGDSEMMSEASFKALAAFCSPSAPMTFALKLE